MVRSLILLFLFVFIKDGFVTSKKLSAGVKEAVVCEGKTKTISCGSGYVISVTHANYGRYDMNRCPHKNIRTTSCFSSRSHGDIKKSCDGRQTCSLYARNSVFDDPCKGTHKYLRVLYRCYKSVYKRVVVCEGASRRINCPKGQVIIVDSASYGRSDRHTCPSSSSSSTSCSAYHSKNIVKARCHYKQSCLLQAHNLVFGDPCRGTYKYLSVKYRCMKPRHKEIVACEGRSRTVSCPAGKSIRIHDANYGRTDVKTCPSSSIKTIRCFAAQSTTKVASSCNGRRFCLLRPFNSVFGDPCRGTYKYLRVRYDCI